MRLLSPPPRTWVRAMKFGVPWSVKGIRPEARETAERSGAPVGRVAGRMAQLRDPPAGRAARRAIAAARRSTTSTAANSPAVHQRLDDLTQRIEQLDAHGPAAYAPKRSRNEPDQLAELIGRLDRRLDQFASASPPSMPNVQMPPSLDRAVAEIAARQRTLNGSAAPAPRQQPPAAMAAPAPRRCRRRICPAWKISSAISPIRSRRCASRASKQAINALREELGEIGRTLTEAMPRRAIEAIEKQIQSLDQRIAEGRQAGVDAGALGGIEHGLAEVRDALARADAGGKPDRLQRRGGRTSRTRSITIVAQKDPATMAQLEQRHHHAARDEQPHRLQRHRARACRRRCRRWAKRSMPWPQRRRPAAMRSIISSSASPRSRTRWPSARKTAARCRRGWKRWCESLSDKIEQIAALARRQRSRSAISRIASSSWWRSWTPPIPGSAIWKRSSAASADLLVHIEDMRANKDAGGLRAQELAGGRRAQARYRAHPGCAGSGARHARPRRRPARHDRKRYSRRAAPARRGRQRRAPVLAQQPADPVDACRRRTACRRRLPPAVRLAPLAPPPAPRRMPPAAPIADRSRSAARSAARARLRAAALRANPAARIAASEAALGGAPPAAAARRQIELHRRRPPRRPGGRCSSRMRRAPRARAGRAPYEARARRCAPS